MKHDGDADATVQALADGMADYVAAARVAPPGTPVEIGRLLADLHADRIAFARPQGMRITTSIATGRCGETPIRIYRSAGARKAPAIVYFHGGGFTTGSIESYDPLAMALAEATEAIVVSVHYARLPEATPKAMIEQCYDVLGWAVRMADAIGLEDAARLAVAGDSAGAFIAAQLAILARDRGGPQLACQVLCYGVFDLDEACPACRTSRDPILSWPILEAMIRTYRSCDARDPGPAPPLRCPDLAGLPPAILVGAEYDPLLEQARDYAAQLIRAGGAADLHVARRMPHGFLRAVRFSAAARREMTWLGTAFRACIDRR